MLLALTVFGCASVKHVNTTDETLDLSKNSVLLLKLDTNNLINPIFKPRIEWLHLKNITTNKSYRVFIPSSGVTSAKATGCCTGSPFTFPPDITRSSASKAPPPQSS